jgi:predicted N-acetyltransferase YhbS
VFRQSYQDNPALLERVFELLETAFGEVGAHIAAAAPLGLDWARTSTPFVKFVDGRAVSHVGVLSLPLVIEGRAVTAAGIHAVCTHPEHRRRGHYRAVMSEAMAWCAARYETAVLFTGQPGLYEPFGFRVVPESHFVVRDLPRAVPDPSANPRLRELDWSHPEDVSLLRKLVRRRTPVSTRLGVEGEEAVFAFNAVSLPMWYTRELDTIVCFRQDGSMIRIFDVVARELPPWQELAAYLPAGTTAVELCFCPDRFELDCSAEPCSGLGHGLLMARGPFVAAAQPVMFPRTAEC